MHFTVENVTYTSIYSFECLGPFRMIFEKARKSFIPARENPAPCLVGSCGQDPVRVKYLQ